MESGLSALTSTDLAAVAKRALPIILLAVFWGLETWRPFFGRQENRTRHAFRNLFVGLLNIIVLGVAFGAATVAIADWAEHNQYGLLHALRLATPMQFLLAIFLLDGWMYLWHRANHTIPVLWRFHRMHHSDRHMDVTTAARFHLGEHLISSLLRLGLIPLLGIEVWNFVVYDTLVIAIIQFHHADISIGRWDRWLRLLIVTPYMHKMHHSDYGPETDSNYSTVLSMWDRLFGSFRMRTNLRTIVFGLKNYTEPEWQSLWGMLKTPLASPLRSETPGLSEYHQPAVRETSGSTLVREK